MQREFHTDRLVLRPVEASDDAAITVAANDLGVAKWLMRLPHPYNLSDAREFISQIVNKDTNFRVILRDGQFLGCMSADPQFGYWFGRHAWGRGYATEAGRAYVGEHFASGGGDLHAGYFSGNDASANVLKKIGFIESGSRQINSPLLGRVHNHDTILTRDHWLACLGMPIETERLFLRPLQRSDAPELQKIAGNDATARNMCSVKSPWPLKDAEAWIEKSRFRGQIGFRLGIELKGGRLIGSVGLGGEADPSVSYFVAEQFWGRGIVSEALSALLQYSFARFDLPMITSDVFVDNPASARVLEKHGFEKIGVDTASSPARVEPAQILLYRLDRKRFLGKVA